MVTNTLCTTFVSFVLWHSVTTIIPATLCGISSLLFWQFCATHYYSTYLVFVSELLFILKFRRREGGDVLCRKSEMGYYFLFVVIIIFSVPKQLGIVSITNKTPILSIGVLSSKRLFWESMMYVKDSKIMHWSSFCGS